MIAILVAVAIAVVAFFLGWSMGLTKGRRELDRIADKCAVLNKGVDEVLARWRAERIGERTGRNGDDK